MARALATGVNDTLPTLLAELIEDAIADLEVSGAEALQRAREVVPELVLETVALPLLPLGAAQRLSLVA